MAGQLTIDTLKASSGVLATQNGMTGIPKAWVRFSAYAGTITSSFNVGSITAYGSGIWGINFTTAMPNANYAWAANAGTSVNNNTNYYWTIVELADYTGNANWAVPTTSQIRIKTMKLDGTDITPDRVSVEIFSA